MNLLDMRTVILSYAVSNLICMFVMITLWQQNRRRFPGIGFWLADFAMQFFALVLVALRGVVPDFLSMTVSNAMIIGGTLLLLIGLEHFTGKRGPQVHNYLLLAVFVVAHAYFAFVVPNLAVRNILFSLGLLVICSQAVWLMLRRVEAGMRPVTRGVGQVFLGFCLVSMGHIIVDLIVPSGNDFFHSNANDTLLLITYQMLFVVLTFSLFLMVNHRLFADLEGDITERKQAGEALRLSEEKFFKAFHASPDAILITRLSDGKLIEVNEGFCHITEYTREEALSSSSIALSLWADPRDREKTIAELGKNYRIQNHELDFRTKSGRILNCLYSGEIIQLGGEANILSIVRDVTERKQMEEALRRREWEFQTLVENSPDAITRFDKEGRYQYVNPARARFFGLQPRDIIGKTWWDLLGPDEVEEGEIADRQFRRMLEYPREYTIEYQTLTPTGPRWVLSRELPEFAPNGSLASILVVTHDITERKQAENILRLRLRLNEFAATHSLNELMQKALDEIGLITNSPIGFYHFVEPDQKTLSLQAWSTRTEKEFCKAEGKGMHYSIDQAGVWVDCVYQKKAIIHNDYASLSHRKGLPPGHAPVIRELVVPILRQGRVVSILGVGNKPTDYDDKDVELVAYIADVVWEIVRRKRAEEKLLQLSRAVEQSPASIVITDTTGKIEYVNPKFIEITGYTLEEAIGKNPRILKTDQTPEEVHRQLWEMLTSGKEWRGEFVNRKKDGELYYESASISPITDNSGVTTHYLAVKEDITERKQAEEDFRSANQTLQLQLEAIEQLQTELREQAIRDPLTGLYNRRYLNETLARELARAVRENHPISFVMIDIDHFKKINDTFGHDTGDVVLRKLAAQLLSQTRVVDIVCRYGGEEFLIILPNVTVAKALEIAERWRKSFMGFTMPLGHSSIQTTISCGVSVFPLDGNTGEELISNADKAMYQAKAAGRNRVVVWQNEMTG